MLVSCVVGVWLGCISVVLNTVRESATPDSKEINKQADAGSRLLSNAFSAVRSCGACRAHGLLRGGVGGKHRAAPQGAIVNLQQYGVCLPARW